MNRAAMPSPVPFGKLTFTATGQRLIAHLHPTAIFELERSVIKLPADIQPMSVLAHKDFRAAAHIHTGHSAFTARFKNVGVTDNRDIVEDLRFGAGKLHPDQLDLLALHSHGHRYHVGA